MTVGEAPTDFVLLTREQLHMCYKGFFGPPAMQAIHSPSNPNLQCNYTGRGEVPVYSYVLAAPRDA